MNEWLKAWFEQTSSQNGEPTRRAKDDVHRMCSDRGEQMIEAAKGRRWHIVATETHYILIPSGTVEILC